MSDLEGRLEALFAADARASRLQAVQAPPRRSRWLAAAAFVVATTVVTVAAVLGFDAVRRSDSGQAAAPPAAVAPSPGGGASSAAVLSPDGKNVVDGRQQAVLAIDDDQIVEWFRTQSQLCVAINIPGAPVVPGARVVVMPTFCTDKAAFKAKTRFASVVGSPDGAQVGFTITMVPSSDPRSLESAAGIFITSTGKIQMLSYLFYFDEQFIGFSPTGKHFVYQGGCFEGNCALFVHDSATLAQKASVNTGADRGQTVTFVRWLSDRAFEYRQYTQPFQAPGATPGPGPVLKTASY